jgi:hypothetical protein
VAAVAAGVKASASFASQAAADPSKADELESSFSSQSAALETAANNVEKFAKDKCGIDLNSSSSEPSGSAASASGSASGDFCEQVANVDPISIAQDPTGAKSAIATLKQLNPPDEIEAEWADYLVAAEEISNVDPNDNDALLAIGQRHISSFAAIGAYISRSCLSAFSGSIPDSSS